MHEDDFDLCISAFVFFVIFVVKAGTAWLVIAIAIGFGIELDTNSIGNDAALLKLGALPDNGQLGGEFWRIGTYSFLHSTGCTSRSMSDCCGGSAGSLKDKSAPNEAR